MCLSPRVARSSVAIEPADRPPLRLLSRALLPFAASILFLFSAVTATTAGAGPVAAGPVAAGPVAADPSSEDDGPAGQAAAAPEVTGQAATEGAGATFVDSVTVTSTRTARPVREVAGQVDVIERSELETRGYAGLADLVRYLPGVLVDGDPTRLGTGGFEIRGIGGNRVTTRIDGVPTPEQFDFGPFAITRQALDVDALESVEVVRSAGSALYGSDALGGVVALRTRSPRSYLGDGARAARLRLGHDGRSEEASLTGIGAVGSDRWQASLLYARRDGHELDNRGELATEDGSRTAPNPIDRSSDSILAQLVLDAGASSSFELGLETWDSESRTEVFSSRAPASPFSSAVLDFDALDTQERRRLSIEHQWVTSHALLDSLASRLWGQESETRQATDSLRSDFVGRESLRAGLLTFEQENRGLELLARKALGAGSGRTSLLTYGASFERDQLDQLRDRDERFVDSGQPVPTTLVFPTKYFPRSTVDQLGLFVQAELALGSRLLLVPGARYDRYELDADQDDAVFLDGNPGTLEPVDVVDEAISPKLGLVLELGRGATAFAQYSHGFRAPPMHEINNGFTNQGGGYRTLPNPDLDPETSDNFELGVRGSFRASSSAGSGARAKSFAGSYGLTVFDNRYDDFIELSALGFDPASRLFEFQSRNVGSVRIAGVELSAEAQWRTLRWRAAYAYTDGEDEQNDQPLASIAPSSLVTGLAYRSPDRPWGAELMATVTRSKDAGDLPADSQLFQVPGSTVLDLSAWAELGQHLHLQVSVWNLGDETYWPFAYARGLEQSSAVLDRYTAPGRSLSAQLRIRY